MSRIVWLTGAAGGIGSAICEDLGAAGWHVVGFDQRESTLATTSIVCDLGSPDETATALVEAGAIGQPSAIVHAAAEQPLKGAGELDAHGWARTLQVNLVTLDLMVGAGLEGLRAANGSVVAITSVHGTATTAGIAAYATSKAALEGWVRAAALDLGPSVRANALAIGAVDTPKLREGFARWGEGAAERMRVLEERTPVGRIATAQEIAKLVAFLIGPDSGFMSGSVLTADGGALARLGSE